MVIKIGFHHSDLLKRIRSPIKKRVFGAFDVETVGEYNEFVLGGYYDERGYKEFRSQEEYAGFLTHRGMRGRWICATNLGFDHTVVFHDTPYWDEFDVLIRHGSLITAKYVKNPRNPITFIDTMNYARLSVEAMGSLIGVEKREPPSWLGEKRPETEDEWRELSHYCEYDCMITYEYMNFLQRKFNELGCELKFTIASSAMNLYQRKHLPFSIKRDEVVIPGVQRKIFESYYGGRVEAFRRGRMRESDDLRIYDINSMYPYVMLENEYPLPESVFIPQYLSLDLIRSYEGVSRVKVKYRGDSDYPLLPLRYENRLMFPKGEFEGYYTHVELRHALELGYDLEPLEHVCYAKTFRPFTSYVSDLYERRKNAYSKAENHVYKLFLNSLYGKFGSRSFTETQFYDTSTMDDEQKRDFYDEWFDPENDVYGEPTGSGYVQKSVSAQAGYVLPIIASYVTSYARILLHDYITKYEAWYCDTDSLITSHRIPESKELGALKCEEVIEDGVIVRAKFYRTDKRVKLKGVSKRIYQDGERLRMNPESFDRIIRDGFVEFDRFSKIRESYKQGLPVNTILRVRKHFDLDDRKREWDGDFSLSHSVGSKPHEVRVRGIQPISKVSRRNITFRL